MKLNLFSQKNKEPQPRNNYQPSWWQHSSDFMTYGEVPLGQVSVGYHLDLGAKEQFLQNLSSPLDESFRWTTIRYTESAMYVEDPQGTHFSFLIPHVFEKNQRIPFSDVTRVSIDNGVSPLSTLKIETQFLTVGFDIGLDANQDAACLLDVWNASKSPLPYFEIGETTNDPRMKWLGNISRIPIDCGYVEELKEIAATWAEISENAMNEKVSSQIALKDTHLLRNFGFSNSLKLNAIDDAKPFMWFILASPGEERSIVFQDFYRAFSMNFEATIPEIERIYSGSESIRPKDFANFVAKTRGFLNSSRGRALFEA